MNGLKHHLSIAGLVLSFAALGFSVATAQEYPTKPITFINPLPVGGGVDIALRGLAKELQPIIGQPVLVESRTGGGTLIAGEYVARAKPDGYTLGCFQSAGAIPEIYTAVRKPTYTSQDLRPAVRYFCLPYALASRAGAPWKNLNELIKYVRENPKKVRWAHSMAIGHPLYVLVYLLFKQHKLEVIEIPFKGAGEVITSLLGGHIDVSFALSVTAIQGHVQAGKMSILALHNPQRLTVMPDIPTFKDQGFDPGVVPIYNVFYVPKATPDKVVKKIHDSVKQAMETPALKAFAKENVFELYYGSEKDIAEEMKKDREVMAPLIEEIFKQQK